MQCQSCQKREATVHLTEINDGVRTELHLCEQCAQEEGIAIKSQIPLNELLSTLLASQPAESELLDDSDTKRRCPHCGFMLEQFRKEALLGCPYDYELFESSLLGLIEKAQDGHTTHCGKVPSRMPADAQKQIKLSILRQQLESAVGSEDYERAAEVRDKINKLE
jgi:protein arginine kinase activator